MGEGWRELAMTDIDGGDVTGALLKQHLAEATGRGTDIETIEAPGREPETVERVLELESGARDIGLGLIGNDNDRVLAYRLRRFRGRRRTPKRKSARPCGYPVPPPVRLPGIRSQPAESAWQPVLHQQRPSCRNPRAG